MSWHHSHNGLEILQLACLSDNYGYLVHDPASGATTAIDTPDANVLTTAVEGQGWQLTDIWNTHWHLDHTGGNEALKSRWGCTITGPSGEKDRIPELDRAVKEGDQVQLGAHTANVLETPGHTSGHIVYHLPEAGVAFVGDTLFALGCGRLFEGTAEQMWHSLTRLRAMPPETVIYCAHEYTQSNGRFAVTIEPDNAALAARMAKIDEARAANTPTVPTTIAEERETNPFLRADLAETIAALNMGDASPEEVFAEIRQRKDKF